MAKVPAKKAFTITNLDSDNAVQKVYVGTKNLYALQRVGSDSYISRAPIDPFTGTAQSAVAQDTMIIKGTGHSQTLDWYQYNGVDYFLVAIKTNDKKWATQIGRVQYKAGTTITGNTLITRMSSINRAQKADASIGTLLRTEAAVSTSRKEILILAMAQDAAGHNTKSVFTRYNLNAVNAIFDRIENSSKNFISAGDAEVRAAAISTMTVNGSLYSKTANNSIQGIDLSDGAAVYLSSGNEGETPYITKFLWNGSISIGKPLYNIYWPKYPSTGESLVETEGLQLKDYLYLGIGTHTKPASYTYNQGNHTKNNYVYYIDKTLF
ncbi:hypothetical protein PL11_007450 [Lentilactobacillus curieae]|uniref:Uncharacterized protein n=1 Tax=Lentilactobacillus curieae TaxID=1138822 RepID=A0A1S6QJF4_9LACO|nr:helveticin J family class III bacteriocin [Lentilactobacillus curieae]AQW21758.1 hypothetical protein PL11_007450 [Lentilactobacillus curieae]